MVPAVEAGRMREHWGGRPALLVVDVSRKRSDPSLDTAYPDVVDAAGEIAGLLSVARELDVPRLFTNGGKSYYTSGGADLDDDERGPWTLKTPVREETPREAELAFELAPQLERREDEPLVTKRTPSAFFDSPLADRLDDLGVDTLVVTGVMTSCCIRATVEDAFAPEYPVVLPRECVADGRPAAHGFHMAEMGEKFADVVERAEAEAYLRSVA